MNSVKRNDRRTYARAVALTEMLKFAERMIFYSSSGGLWFFEESRNHVPQSEFCRVMALGSGYVSKSTQIRLLTKPGDHTDFLDKSETLPAVIDSAIRPAVAGKVDAVPVLSYLSALQDFYANDLVEFESARDVLDVPTSYRGVIKRARERLLRLSWDRS